MAAAVSPPVRMASTLMTAWRSLCSSPKESARVRKRSVTSRERMSERETITAMGTGSSPSSCQVRSCPAIRSQSTGSSSAVRPPASRAGMKCSGSRSPQLGCFHRASTSAPSSCPPRGEQTG